MAYHILKEAVENPDQKSFVAFLGRNHLMPVAKQIANFLNGSQGLGVYQRP
jgi:hypothetical protein